MSHERKTYKRKLSGITSLRQRIADDLEKLAKRAAAKGDKTLAKAARATADKFEPR